MTITFANDSEIIVYTLEKIISFARENQYLFVANCAWWIAGEIGLDRGLVIHIDNLASRIQNELREDSSTPRNTARADSVNHTQNTTSKEAPAISRSEAKWARKRKRLATVQRNRQLGQSLVPKK